MHRMSEWTPDMISFMVDASDYGSYFSELASCLSGLLDASWTVCDAGCGIGQLSVALSPMVKKVVAIDRSVAATDFLKKRISSAGLGNVEVLAEDFDNLPAQRRFDAMIFNYFGRVEQILDIAVRHCLRRAIIIRKVYGNHRFSIGTYPIEQPVQPLNGVDYTEREFSCEFGQPFRSIDDAIRFFELYSRDGDKSVINEKNVRSRLVETGNPVFPYYLPHLKKSNIYIIDRGSYGKPLQ